jgi:hypothetical protein
MPKPLMPIKPGKLAMQPQYDVKPIVMRPIFFDPHTNQIIDRTPQEPEKEKPFSDILKRKS